MCALLGAENQSFNPKFEADTIKFVFNRKKVQTRLNLYWLWQPPHLLCVYLVYKKQFVARF